MDAFFKNKWFLGMLYTLLGMLILLLMLQVRPLLVSLYEFLAAILAPFLIAMIIAYVLNPVVVLLNQRKMPRPVAVLLIYAIFFTSLAVICVNMIPMFVEQFGELNEHMPELSMRAQSMMDTLNDNQFLPESVRNGINHSLQKIEAGVAHAVSEYISGIGATINMFLLAFIIPFLAFYILKDFAAIQKAVLTIVPRKHRQHTIMLLSDIDAALGSYVRGQFLVCMIVGFLAWLGYWLIGMPYPLLLASVVAIFNIIPYIGPYFGATPAIVMAAMVSWKLVLYVVLLNLAIQIVEGNIISPQVVGRTLHMHPLTIIFVLLVGGELAGIVGLILAVPAFAVMKVIVQHVKQYYWHRTPE